MDAAPNKLKHRALRCPPLSCRTSPPQGGRLAGRDVSLFLQRWRLKPGGEDGAISPVVGEMSGRTEGGAKEYYPFTKEMHA
jgi:hypothetical protein